MSPRDYGLSLLYLDMGRTCTRFFPGKGWDIRCGLFYVLSGITLSYIYASQLTLSKADLLDFHTKRFFRILPLLWLATGISILLSKHVPNTPDLVLNLTGLFGLFKWNTYFATGAWSIGNELRAC